MPIMPSNQLNLRAFSPHSRETEGYWNSITISNDEQSVV